MDTVLLQECLSLLRNILGTSISSEGLGDIELFDEVSEDFDERPRPSPGSVDLEPVGESVNNDSIAVSGQLHVVCAYVLEWELWDHWIHGWKV